MTLLEELKSIDLSKITEARASIRVSVEAPELKRILNGGAAQTALAGLGGSLQGMRANFSQPADLLKPLLSAVGSLDAHFKLDGVPIAPYLDAVRQGAGIMASVFGSFSDDPAKFGKVFGLSLGEAFDKATSLVEGYAHVSLDGVTQFRTLVETIESGVPTDPAAFAEIAAAVLLPFPKAGLIEIRDSVKLALNGAASIDLPRGRTSGLLSALDKITAAAIRVDGAALKIALDDLEQVRLNTIASIRNDLLAVFSKIGSLQFDVIVEPIIRVGGQLRIDKTGIIEMLEGWRKQIALAHKQIDDFDPAKIAAYLPTLLKFLEDNAQSQIVQPIEAQVKKLEEWLRALLGHLPLRALRAELTGFILSIAESIRHANLDAPIRAVFAELDKIQAQLNPAALAAEVKAALAKVQQAIENALGGVISALEKISAEVNAVAGSAEAILGRASKALGDFKAAIDEVKLAVNNLGIEQAAQQIVETLTKLRETAEKLLTVAPLPESMRPTIEQLVETLKSVDLDVGFKPVADAAAELKIPDQVSVQITAALKAADDAIQNLIPAQLIASIEAEVNSALDTLRGFNPGPLPDVLKTFLNETADFILKLDPRSKVADIAEPFQKLLAAVDKVHPHTLLAPVIDAYDSLLGKIPMPAPSTAARRTAELINAAGEKAGRAAAEPIRRLAPPGSVELADPKSALPAPEAQPGEVVRPGDVIRMFGFLPNKLREALAALDAGPAGAALRAVDSLCAGLARDLRAVQAAIFQTEARISAGFEEMLAPLSFRQGQAQLAIRANFSGGSFNVDGALEMVARAGPGALRASLSDSMELALGLARQTGAGITAKAGGAIERAAAALEATSLHSLTGDLNAFLKALDPEPIAAELDALVLAALKRTPAPIAQLENDIKKFLSALRDLVTQYNPGMQAQKFLAVLDVLRQELDLLNPRRLADELGEVHAAIRDTIARFDPAAIAEQFAQRLMTIAANLRALDLNVLLGDLNFLAPTIARIEAASPAKALAGVGAGLKEVGHQLELANPGELLKAVSNLGPQVVEALKKAAEAIKKEIIALLEALRYASGSASASVHVQVG